ncbi:DUF6078 family protein [Phocaeicola sp.]
MPKRFYTSIPTNYPACEHKDCPMAAICLHQTVYTTMLENEEYIHLINPHRCSKNETCSYYRDNKPITYTRGFTNFQKQMFPEQYQRFMSILIETFGRNPYFERRRGETALSPKEQDIVLRALKRAGVTKELKFDNYEENLNWYD